MRACILWVVAASACFSDAPPLADEGTTTGGTMCAVGSEGCFCTAGNGCDADLVCLLPAGVCIGEDCMPGAALCECAGGACIDGYECVDNVCVENGSATFSTSDAMDTGMTVGSTMPPTSGSDDTSGSATLDPGTTTDLTASDVSTEPSSASASTTGSATDCLNCRLAAYTSDCMKHWIACADCEPMWGCFATLMPADCCVMVQPTPVDWHAFAQCIDDACSADCSDSIDCG